MSVGKGLSTRKTTSRQAKTCFAADKRANFSYINSINC